MAAHFTPSGENAILEWSKAQKAPCTLARIDRDGSGKAGAYRVTFTISAELPLPRPIAACTTAPPPYAVKS
jgi:hypothetical protein